MLYTLAIDKFDSWTRIDEKKESNKPIGTSDFKSIKINFFSDSREKKMDKKSVHFFKVKITK